MDFIKKMDAPETRGEEKSGNVEQEHVKCLIIGSGPAGYTAAIYAARANLSPVMYEGMQPGGQLTTTTEVENFPGYPEGIDGPTMMEDLKKQASRFGTDIRFGYASAVDFSGDKHKVEVDGNKEILAETVIIATGATAKYLGLESEEKYMGGGVSACATCDGFFYKGKDVAVVGGGDSAAEESTYLANLCRKVYLIIRKPYMRASKIMQERAEKTDNIEILFEHNTKEIVGENGVVNGVIVVDKEGNEKRLDIDGFFLAIGHKPNTDIFVDYLKLDDVGYIITENRSTKTNVPGVFACGDVMDPHYRQAVTAAGSGCMAAIDAERYLGEKAMG